MSLDVDVDPTYTGGYPGLAEAKRHNTSIVRMITRPPAEALGGQYMANSIEVLGVVTGQSYANGGDWRRGDPYIMPSISALQIGNEPMMGHAASYPAGGPEEFIEFWNKVRHYVRFTLGRTDLPLVGPGIWMQRPELWASIRNECHEVTAAGVHVYEGFGDSFATPGWVDDQLEAYAAVAPDINLWCTEFTARHPHTVPVLDAINRNCDVSIWAHYGHGVPGHGLVGTTEYQLLATHRR